MSDPGISAVRIRKGDTVFHVHGDNAGAEGVYLAKGQVHGIYDAPVKTTWKTGAFQVGSKQRARKWLHRDMTLGFHIIDTSTLYELNESRFRQLFDYEDDLWDNNPTPTIIEIETVLSGVRKLDVLMYEEPEFESDLDPQMQQYGNLIMKLRAGQPFWYEPDPDTGDDYVSTFTSTSASASGVVMVENPTDQIMYQKFILTRGTWTLPDVQWVGAKGFRERGGPNADRTISGIVVADLNGGATVDLDRQELMFRDANNTNLLGQLAGKFFNYAIPPYTPQAGLPVSYTGAPAGGAMVQLVQPRRWSRPWGLELEVAESTTARFTAVGSYTYGIPEWCDTLDVVLLGGGGGGDGGDWEFLFGETFGGTSGAWSTTTLVRGVDIPWETSTITGTVGVGGHGGIPKLIILDNSGHNGSATTATATGMTTLTAAGGVGGGNSSDTGQGAGQQTFNGYLYRGGGDVTAAGRNGTTPGGGGAAGQLLQGGGKGAGGAVYIRAYQNIGGS